MEDTELKLFIKKVEEFIEHTSGNFSQLFKDRENDHKLLEDVMRDVNKNKTEVELLKNNVSEAVDSIKQTEKRLKEEAAATKAQFEAALQEIRDTLAQKKIVYVQPKPNIFKRIWRRITKRKEVNNGHN